MGNNNIINRTELPDILSDDEFDYYFKQFSGGNLDALDILVEHNLRLVYWYIDKNINCETIDYDEVFSVGLEALLESFYTFDMSKNVKFSTYATICIRNKILKYFRSESKHDKVISLDETISDSHNTDTLGDRLVDDNITLEERIIETDLNDYQKQIIAKTLETLNDIDKKIVMLYFGFLDGKVHVQKEICKILGISQSQISKRLSNILKEFRKNLELDSEYDSDKRKLLARKVA